MWAEKDESRGYAFMKFTETSVTIGKVFHNGKELARTRSFYLSNTEDDVFDQNKVGKSRTGRYLVINYPDLPPAHLINGIDARFMTLTYNSKGKTLQTYNNITLYARQNETSPDWKLFEIYQTPYKGYQYVGGSFYLQRDAQLGGKGEFRYTLLDDKPMGWSIAEGEYYNEDGERTGSANIVEFVMPDTQGYAWQRWEGGRRISHGGFRKIVASNPLTSRFASLSKNGHYIQTRVGQAEVLIFLGECDSQRLWLYIAALTPDDAQFIYAAMVNVLSIDLTPGKFRIVMDEGDIYEANGAIYWAD